MHLSLRILFGLHYDSLQNEISLLFSTSVGEHDEDLLEGRVGVGIGSTPSIMMLDDGQKVHIIFIILVFLLVQFEAVVVSSGSIPMEVVLIHGQSGEILATYETPEGFMSEQSVGNNKNIYF